MNRFVFKISKVVVFTLLFVGFATAQNPLELYTTPAGTLDDAFDRFGKKYKLLALKKPESNFTPFALPLNTISTSRFNLYYESGCGMELTTNTTHIARRKIVEKVLEDVSAFMNVPFSETKVNIWVRNLANVTNNTNQTMSVGSSFYNVPKNATGSITDGEVWKTLLSGNDSYTNVTPTTDAYYHGMLAFNFATYNSATIKWHTKLESNPAAGFYDFYSAVLREVVHLLGITSLIDPNGNSVFGTDYKYYSRYDRLLKNNASTQFLLKNTGTVGMYNYNFVANPTILRPSCTLPNYTNPSPADATTCANALKYVGSTTLPVYTPTCFEKGVSLSHFEDQLYPSCTAAYGNNSYFVMSNKSNLQSVKRYLKPQERLALADLGYPLKTIYGTTTTLNGYYNYGGSPTASALVVGVNDGINPDFTFAFTGTAGSNITITGNQLLSNDTNATAFEGLQDLTAPATTTLSTTTGNASTTITFTSTTPGVHLLRYVPKNAAGQTGNVTYFYAYVSPNNNCATTPVCNLVYNGDFEQNNGQIPDESAQLYNACNWENFGNGSADYFHADTTNPDVDMPVNFFGNQTDNIVGNKAYAGFYIRNFIQFPNQTSATYGEIIKTKLATPLEPNTNYQISYKTSLAESNSKYAFKHQILLTSQNFPPTNLWHLSLPQTTSGTFLTNNQFVTDTNNWQTVTFNFTTTSGGEEYLYLGALYNNPFLDLDTISTSVAAYYYIDNVVLRKTTNNTSTATNDSLLFNFSNAAQTATANVLTNDTVNGVAFTPPVSGVTVAQVSSSNAGVGINPQGFITVAGGTPVGTYTLVYNFTTPCGVSNNATVTVEVTSHSVVFEVPGKYACVKSCFSTVAETIDFGFFNPVNWGDYVGLLVNGVPATASMVTVHLAPGSTLPAGVTLNPNGTLTIPSSYQLDLFTFSVVFCSTASPNECSEPVFCCFSRDITRTATADTKTYNTIGNPILGESNSLLTNDYLSCYNATVLMNTLPATANNSLVVETTSPANAAFTIGTDGQINVNMSSVPIPVGSYTLTYKLCNPMASYICSQEVTVTINVQSASGRQSFPKHKPTQTKVTQSTTDPIIYFPDANLKSRLTDLDEYAGSNPNCPTCHIDINEDGEIQVSEALNITTLLLAGFNISDLTGLEYFTNLQSLYMSYNNISNLQPIQNLTSLEGISLQNNNLSTVNFSNNTNLKIVGGQGNNFNLLNFNNNPLFNKVSCQNNPLTHLYIKNNSMQLFDFIDSSYCFPPSLTYICADAMEIPALQSFLTGCGYNLANITITSDCVLGEHSFSKNVVKVFPNPSNTGVFSVELPVVSKGNVFVYNALGQKVYESSFVNQTFTLPLNFLPKGTYFLKLITENQEVFEEKLVVN